MLEETKDAKYILNFLGDELGETLLEGDGFSARRGEAGCADGSADAGLWGSE